MNFPEPMVSTEERVAMATRCRDCDDVPKVADAGMVFEIKGRRLQIMHNGLKVVADGYYGSWMTDLIRLCRGHHEVQEERLFHEVERRLSETATMIELGGFWSYYSLWFLMNHQQRSAVVIEPEPTHLEIGRANAELNGLTPIFKQGFASAAFTPESSFQTEVSGSLQLPGYSVEHLMREQGWSHLNLLHLDIQGAETDILTSCRELFENRQIDWVFASTHAHQISGDALTHQRCLAVLRDCGATIEAEHDVHESFSGDGLIVARFGPPPAHWSPIKISSNRASQSLFRHLAYDLAESQARERSSQMANVHESLEATGSLLRLGSDGPLGRAGTHLVLPDDKVMSPHVRAAASWDFEDVISFASHVRADTKYSLIDIGANIGLFSRQLLHLSPQIEKVFCLEPDPDNFRALQYNLADFHERVALFNLALSDVDSSTRLLRDVENIGNYSFNPDAMRGRPHDAVEVTARSTEVWMMENLNQVDRLLWKSDTQGLDELILAQTPIDIWDRVDVALLEIWRIAKPAYDAAAFRFRIESFPNAQLGGRVGVSVDDVLEYLSGDDWKFENLLLWR